MDAAVVQRRLELLRLVHHHSLEVHRVIERAAAMEQWMTGEPQPTYALAELLREADKLTGTPKGSV